MALIPPFFLDCVVSIGLPPVASGKPPNWIGTGFIVGRPYEGPEADGKEMHHTFLVTNKHVLKDKTSILLRFNSIAGKTVKDYPVNLIENSIPIWVGHKSSSIDVAAFVINPNFLKQEQAHFQYFKLDKHVLKTDEMKSEGVSEGDGIFVLGFPLGIVAPQRNCVISRLGAIARVRDVLDKIEPSYLIDANIFPGNSGGPVIIKPEFCAIENTKAINKSALIGIVKSYVPYNDIAVSQQTGNPRVIFEENSGLALVETVDSIIEVVDECFSNKLKITP